jgi:glycerol-3-phosphate acyltransferase PlsY
MMNLNLPPGTVLSGKEWTWVGLSYFLGCFTAGYYWTRWKTGQDIRQLGSGNVGARNVGRVLGHWGFTITFLLDFLKGVLAVAGAQKLGLSSTAIVLTIGAVVAGHIWPIQLRGLGGKGIATSLGALLAYDPILVLCQIMVFLPVIAILRSFTLSGMVAFAVGPLVAFLAGLENVEVVAAALPAILVLLAHRKNIREEITRFVQPSQLKESPVKMHKGPPDEV